MRLSEAILLGSTIIRGHSYAFGPPSEGTGCALDMAMQRGGAFCLAGGTWSWLLEERFTNCPACERGSAYLYTAIEHMSDAHVFPPIGDGSTRVRMTLEQLVDWVRSVEPAELPTEESQSRCEPVEQREVTQGVGTQSTR